MTDAELAAEARRLAALHRGDGTPWTAAILDESARRLDAGRPPCPECGGTGLRRGSPYSPASPCLACGGGGAGA